MSHEPLVSILMNCYNGEQYLREAIDSVLAQTYQNWEIIFWDNRSTDRSASIFKSYEDPRLKYFCAPQHTDLGGGRAQAWQHLNGEFIAILDVDDIWLPEKLEKQIPLFEDPDVGIVISDILYFNEKRSKPRFEGNYPPTGLVCEDLLAEYFVPLLTLVFRRATALRLPRAFDPDFSFIADFDLVVRLSRISKLALYPGILAKGRVHSDSHSWRYPEVFLEERERWMVKQIREDPSFATSYESGVRRFNNVTSRAKVLTAIHQNQRFLALKTLLKSGFDHWHFWVLLLACFFPFAGTVLSYRKQRQFELA